MVQVAGLLALCHLCHLSTKCASVYGEQWAPHLSLKCREIKSYRRTSWMSTSEQCIHSGQSACVSHWPPPVQCTSSLCFWNGQSFFRSFISWSCRFGQRLNGITLLCDRADWTRHKGRATRRNHSLIFVASFFRLATIAVVCPCRSVC